MDLSLFDRDDLDYTEQIFLGYLIWVVKYLKDTALVDGVKYYRLSDYFARKYFKVSKNTIRKWFTNLEKHDYIKIWKPNNKVNGIRYFLINTHIIDKKSKRKRANSPEFNIEE